jgi:hypothetical protein
MPIVAQIMPKCFVTYTPLGNVVKLFWHNLCHYRRNLSQNLKETLIVA